MTRRGTGSMVKNIDVGTININLHSDKNSIKHTFHPV